MTDSSAFSLAEIAAYYDADCERCLRDYVRGNARVRHATEFILSQLKPRCANRVLEVGCGIGISSYAMCQEYDGLQVVGIDISEKRIDLARRLFLHPRLQFCPGTIETAPVDGAFDAIVMLDVYEHIPRSRVSAFHEALGTMLNREGVILLTTPSSLHQARIAASNPSGLQIVDESIGVEEIAGLARETGGILMSFNHRTVWHTNDYVYSVIERVPRYERPFDHRTTGQKIIGKVPHLFRAMMANRRRRMRSEFVYQRLGVRIS